MTLWLYWLSLPTSIRLATGSLSWVGHSDSFTVLRARSIPGLCHGKRSSL
eukprot:COSAG01_NODE_67529_length_266_cov_5.502994_1_plen_49_part_10